MINITNNNIIDITIGSTSIEKAYLGSQLVWEKSVPTVVDTDGIVYYIKNYISHSASSAYINTGVSTNIITRVSGKFNNSTYKHGANYLGSRGGNYNRNMIEQGNTKLNFAWHTSASTTAVNCSNTGEKEFDFTQSSVTFNGTTVSRTGGTLTTTYSYYVCASNNSNKVNLCTENVKWYYLKIYGENDTLIRDYIPVQRVTDSVWGFFDLVNNIFYSSANSYSFSGG